MVVACVGSSAFFIVMYSLQWGKEKSLQWLTGMLLHLVQDIIAIQTVKVILMAFVNSAMLQTPDDGVGDSAKAIVNADNKTRQTELFKRLRNILAGIAHNVGYVISFALVIGLTVNPNAYRMVKSVKPLVTVDGIQEDLGVVNYDDVFDWLEFKLVPKLLVANQLGYTETYRTKMFYQMTNHEIYLLGPIRVRQLRASPSQCLASRSPVPAYVNKVASNINTNYTGCQLEFPNQFGFVASTEKRLFNGSWETLVTSVQLASLNVNETEAIKSTPWAYRDSAGLPYSGKNYAYATGGYYLDVPFRSFKKALKAVQQLRAQRWLDNSTAAVIVEMNIFNAQLNLFLPVKIVFEALEAGGMTYHTRIYPLQLYLYFGANAIIALMIQGLWLVMTITHTVKLIVQIKRQKKQFFKNGWNLLECFTIVLTVLIMVIYVLRFPYIMDAIETIQTNRDEYFSLDTLVSWEDLLQSLFGFGFMMNLFLFFRYLSFNKHWAIFCGTLAHGKADILSFAFIFIFLTVSYASLGYLLLGHM